MGLAQINKGGNTMSNLYYELSNGELVPKHKVDAAFELIERLKEGCSIVGLSDIDVFTKGDKLDAILRFRNKYDTPIAEAKEAIEFLREE